jgi:uncharacterized membrane protein YfcA
VISAPILAAVLAVVFLAGLVRGAFGFGDALLGMPLLALFVPLTFATPLMALVGPTLAVLILVKEWRSMDVRGAGVLIASTMVGIPLGLLVLKFADTRIVNLILAAVISGCGRPAPPRSSAWSREFSAPRTTPTARPSSSTGRFAAGRRSRSGPPCRDTSCRRGQPF